MVQLGAGFRTPPALFATMSAMVIAMAKSSEFTRQEKLDAIERVVYRAAHEVLIRAVAQPIDVDDLAAKIARRVVNDLRCDF